MENTNVLIVGGAGAREFALTRMARESGVVGEVHTFCNNAGTRRMKDVTVAEMPKDHDRIVNYCAANDIDFVVVGPEAPLAAGLSDTLREAGILVFGPGQEAAQLETSKLWAVEFMERHGVPTAKTFSFHDLETAKEFVEGVVCWPIVVKYNGLMGGKGVTVCGNLNTAYDALQKLYKGEEDATVLIQEYLPDNPKMKRAEVSVHIIVSGDGSWQMLPVAQDYKPRFDKDLGPMTGGMGCHSMMLDADIMNRIRKEIVEPTVAGLQQEGLCDPGTIYAGLKLCPEGPKVVEYNVRFGDPEMIIIDQMVTNDLLPIMLAAAKGENISGMEPEIFDGAAIGVVVVGKNYPTGSTPAQDFPPHLDQPFTYHAATRLEGKDGTVVAEGGRIAVVSFRRHTLKAARKAVYDVIGNGKLGKHLAIRSDICQRLTKTKKKKKKSAK